MPAIIRADALDQHGVDLVNTNRSQLREDNEIVGSLVKFIEEAIRKSLAAHAKRRESDVDQQIEKSKAAKRMMRLTNTLAGEVRTSTKQLLRALAVKHGADSTEFN
ncbi:hypothetical protein [Sphingomonas sp. G-3-2-10]|uniref:hypothetical protein n=1 Tax=Sphingomonas sp. G-3-2-10 TaxID=2728838 RepID=UPI00146EBF67|nr:hypothetical protein [Sphingomonas sp. G-3-2-10]NML04905.1 hypothetical protein [Sphingomonas sp. G-3-2-10]